MYETRIEMAEGQCLTLTWVASNVRVAGWEGPEVLLRLHDGEERELTVEDTQDGPAVSARVACDVKVPRDVEVKVRESKANLQVSGIRRLEAEQVRGNLKVDDVEEASVAEVYGNLRAHGLSSLSVVGTVFGDATLKQVEAVDVQNVRGNLTAKNVSQLRASRTAGNLLVKEVAGKFEADQVGGNASLKNVEGPVALNQVAGNLMAKNLTGGARVPKIGGNLVLHGQIAAGRTYHFSTRGNASLGLAEGTNAHLTLVAGGKLLSSVGLVEEQREGNRLTGSLGEGGAEVVVEARGNLVLGGGRGETGADLGEEIARQIEESLQGLDLEAIGRQVSEEMESALSRLQVKLEGVDWERMGVQTQRAVERAMEQMQRNMDRMVDKAARHQERLERKVEREQRRWAKAAGAGQDAVDIEVGDRAPEPEAAAAAAASAGADLDAERLSILRMVEQGQITPEDAEMLLDALEE